MQTTKSTEVIVIGAGYAGLASALTLHDAGTCVLVLEANDRVGGRIFSEAQPDGTIVDHGGQWIGPTQHRLHAYADRFDVGRFKTYTGGANLELWHDGTVRGFGLVGPEDGPGIEAYAEATARIDELARTVNLEQPALTPNAEALDSETAHSYFERTVADPDARLRLALAVQGVWTVELRDLSMLHLLFYVAAAGDFEQLMEAENCAQDSRFFGGAQEPANRIAAHLGDAVRLGTRVLEVHQEDDRVRVVTDQGEYTAQHVISTLPPQAASRVRFTPELPLAKRRFVAKSVMGDVAKIHVGYQTPFWRTKGFSGEAVTYGAPMVGVIFDNSPDDAASGVLVCFVYADRLREWQALDAEARREEVIATLVRMFGEEARAALWYTEKNWSNDEFAGGGYAATPAPGTWIEHAAAGWREPVGRLHWAGTETASVWNGYIDGAIRSGERAAAEILG
ncbi:FAD-dependent oxidoreductase [Leucobacter sp. UCMA 4100]|uniref:flavin monoamine oxidase family protein n=1 Tax=Leucobacter sp. UCMA 4100 TaxID=2810534 RepID=UPI0022EA3566|nr:FAD-dependent oxidoreductase [Leucobacter sp. UCMA 4100]MDA3146558.1 FAD-dependent oxidoreductase [Leucobacter sp. UCMA 4100]